MGDCQICKRDSEYSWRLEEVETKVERLNNLLLGTLISSISTLVGVVVILVTK